MKNVKRYEKYNFKEVTELCENRWDFSQVSDQVILTKMDKFMKTANVCVNK